MKQRTPWLSESFRITHAHYLGVLKRFWVWLVGLGVLSIAFDELTLQIQRTLQNADSIPIFYALLLVTASMFWGVVTNAFLVVFACVGLEDAITQSGPTSAMDISHDNLVPLTIELMRALGVSLCWGILFVIPGVVKYIRFTFVPYIVLFDPGYKKGEVDALERSEAVAKGHTLALFITMIAFLVFLLALNGINQTLAKSFMENPVGTVLTQVFSQLGSLYFAVFLFAIYKSLNKMSSSEGAHEPGI